MILVYLIVILLTGAFLSLFAGRRNPLLSRIICTVALGTDLILIIPYLFKQVPPDNKWLIDIKFEWIQQFGISFHLAMDGLSLLMLALTFFLGIVSVIISWKEINEKVGFFHFNLLLIL